MSAESEYLPVQSVYLAPTEPESFTMFALDTQGKTVAEVLATYSAKAVRVLAVMSPQGKLEVVPDDTAPEGVAVLWNGERRYPAPMSATPEGVPRYNSLQMDRLGCDWPVGHYAGKCAECGVGFSGDKRDPVCVQCAIAAHVAARVGEAVRPLLVRLGTACHVDGCANEAHYSVGNMLFCADHEADEPQKYSFNGARLTPEAR